jgi:uncharacterized protein YkwD
MHLTAMSQSPSLPSSARPEPNRIAPARKGRVSRVRRRVAVLSAVFGLLASLLVVVAPTADARTLAERRMSAAVFAMINSERRAHHLRALTSSPALTTSAHWHDRDMAAYNEMSHQLPHEAYFTTRMEKAGYHWMWAGENIGWNSVMTTSGALALEKMMYDEKAPNDGHRLNILNSHYRNVGVDVLIDTKHHKIWLTTDYGSQ